MAISLSKGQGVNLNKSENDLSQVTIGLGWDATGEESVLSDKLRVPTPEEYDLDAIAFLLNEQGKVCWLGPPGKNGGPTLVGGDVIFYNSLRHESGAIWLTGDNRTGVGDGDDEQIIVRLDQLPHDYKKILFIVQVYKGIEKNQNFSKVRNAYIRAVDNRNKEMCRFDLSGNPAYADCRALVFAELERQDYDWKCTAVEKPYATDTFTTILKEYVSQ